MTQLIGNTSLTKALMMGLLAGFFMLNSGCASTDSSRAKGEIEAILNQQGEAWNKGDIEAFMQAYEPTEALLFTSGGKVRQGYAETLAKYKASYGNPGAMGKLDFAVLDLRLLSDTSAVMLGSWELTETPKAGGGLFTLVWLHTSDGWKIVHDHTSLGPKELSD